MDNTSFHLKYAPDQKLNVRLIENTDPKSIIRGNVGDLLTVLNDLSYIDVENDDYIHSTPEAMKLYKLTQFGLQYMMFTVSKLGDNVLLLKDYLKIQDDKKAKMAELIQQQEDTLKRLRNKKKTLAEAEKQYAQIVKTLNVEPNLESKENGRNNGNVSGGEGDSARNTIPKKSILKKDSKKPEGENMDSLKNKISDLPASEKNEIRRYILQEAYGKAQPPLEDLSVILGSQTMDKNAQSANQDQNRKNPIKDSQQSVDLSLILGQQSMLESEKSPGVFETAKKKTGEEREAKKLLLQEGLGKSPPQVVDLDTILASQASDKSTGTKNVEVANKQKQSNIKIEDQEKEEGEIYEDDYEDDFELSTSQVKSTLLGQSSKLRESKGDYNGDETASFDVSTVTQKTFDGGYLEKLDRIVSKNKGDVEVNLKDFSK